MKSQKITKYLIIATILVIWGQSMLRSEASLAESDTLLKILNPFEGVEIGDINSDMYLLMSELIRKAAHVFEYAVLGAELMIYRYFRSGLPSKTDEKIQLLISGMLVAMFDETIQVFSHRGSSVTDVWIDTTGVFLGLLVSRLVIKLINNKKHK